MALPNPRLEARQLRWSALPTSAIADEGRVACIERHGRRAVARGGGAGDARPLHRARRCGPFAPRLRRRRLTPSALRFLRACASWAPPPSPKGALPPRVIDAPDSLGARGRLGGRPRRFGGPAIQTALARIVARCGGRVTDFQAVEENQCWYGFAGGDDRRRGGRRCEGSRHCAGSRRCGRRTASRDGPFGGGSAGPRFPLAPVLLGGSCPHEGGHGGLGSRGRGECGERDGGAGVRC